MLERKFEFFLLDILISADIVARHIHGVSDAEEFVGNELLFSAVTRECEIIGEATNIILKSSQLQHLVKPAWRKVVDFRNVISHEYFGLNYEDIFEIITTSLPIFIKDILAIIETLRDSEDFKLALSGAQNDLNKIGRHDSVKYLKHLESSLAK